MMHAFNDIASSADARCTYNATIYFLNYAACNPDANIIYQTSDIILQANSNAAYLVSPKAQSCAGGYHFLGNADRTQFNGPVLILAKIIKNVMASVAEAEVAPLYLNAKEVFAICQCLIKLGYPQPPTPLKSDNVTACGILTGTIKQKRSKAIDM